MFPKNPLVNISARKIDRYGKTKLILILIRGFPVTYDFLYNILSNTSLYRAY